MAKAGSVPFSGKIKLDLKSVLGNGSFGSVFKGTYESEQVAVKRILVVKVSAREIKLQPTLDHENVLKVYAVEEDENFG